MSEAYCSVADVRAEGVTEARADDERVTELIALAGSVVARVCGQRFGPHPGETVLLDGTGHVTLWLPEPLGDTTSVIISDPSFADEVLDADDYVVYGGFIRRVDGWYWTAGDQNVAVTGTWGCCEDGAVPPAVKRACVLMVVDAAMTPRAKGPGRGRLLGERTGSYSYNLAQATAVATGHPEADALLAHYRRQLSIRSV